MRGPTDATEERRAYAQQSSLTALVRHLGRDEKAWLNTALEPLPETFRISLHRADRQWTVEQVKAIGAIELPWMPSETAFMMPFARGKAPEGLPQRLMALLHETGRITRQEAASMLPVRLLTAEQNILALDMCAAPGSKTTQLGERLHPEGVVVANEPVSGRLNMLVSNKSRLGLANIVVTQHDGRHFGRLPPPGFDAVIADVPCTGTATTRKNRDVWWDWTPKEGRKMFKMQVEITARVPLCLFPVGRCILPGPRQVENEAVVAGASPRAPGTRSWNSRASLHQGLTSWPVLDESGTPVPLQETDGLPFFTQAHLAPNERMAMGIGEKEQEQEIAAQLPLCLRLWHEDNNTGGFFVAQFRHRMDGEEERFAKAYRSRRATRREEDWVPTVKAPPKPTANSVIEATDDVVAHVEKMYGIDLTPFSLWQRGKRLNLAHRWCTNGCFSRPHQPTKAMCGVGNPSIQFVWCTPDSLRSRSKRTHGAPGRKRCTPTAIRSQQTWNRSSRIHSSDCSGDGLLMEEFYQETAMNELPRGLFCSKHTPVGD